MGKLDWHVLVEYRQLMDHAQAGTERGQSFIGNSIVWNNSDAGGNNCKVVAWNLEQHCQ